MAIELRGGKLDTITLKGRDGKLDTITLKGELGNYIEVSSQSYDFYDGEYVVIPATTDQTLETANKVLTDDVLVTSVPFYETSNPDGTTVYIASKIGD